MKSWSSRYLTPFAEVPGHLEVLTGIRGFAALWVFAYHAWGAAGYPEFRLSLGHATIDLTPPVAIGFAGVTVFFVLSGFLLALPFIECQQIACKNPELSRYLLRRVRRVFPAYYAQLAILIAVGKLVGNGTTPEATVLWRHLLMLFMPPPLGTPPLNLVWWTLPIEFSFYLMLPILSYLLRPSRAWFLLVFCIGSMWLWRFAIVTWSADAPLQLRVYSSYQLSGSLDMFGLGMCGALIHAQRARLPKLVNELLKSDAITLLGIGLLIVATYWLAGNRALYWANNPIFYLWTPLVSFGTVIIVLAGASGGRLVGFLFGNRAMLLIGLVSYSLYLWHFPVLNWVGNIQQLPAGGLHRFVMLLGVGLPASLLVATLSYMFIEYPFMHNKLARFSRARPK